MLFKSATALSLVLLITSVQAQEDLPPNFPELRLSVNPPLPLGGFEARPRSRRKSPANGVQDLRGGTDVGIWNRSRTSRRSSVRTNRSWTTNGHPALSPTRSTRVAGESR